jgi:cell division control protein 6
MTEKLLSVPLNHFLVLTGMTVWTEQPSGEIKQPVTTAEVVEYLHKQNLDEAFHLSERAVRELVTDLETMGLIKTWIDSRGREGRVKQIEIAFDPQWVRDVIEQYITETEQVDSATLLADTGDSR